MAACDLALYPVDGNRTPDWGILAIGHSHLTAASNAFSQRRTAPAGELPDQFRFLQLLNEEFKPPIVSVAGTHHINEALAAAILHEVADLPPKKAIALFLSGNEYHFIGMFNQPRPYDFVLPERPDLPLLPGAEVIPVALIERKLHRNIRAAIELVPLIAAVVGTDIPLYGIESPPPIPDNDYIATGKAAFSENIERFGVSPASLRYKLWSLQSRVFKQCFNDVGVMYLRNPADAIDAAGFMLQPGWHPDSVHGSTWFGDRILTQIKGVFVGPAVEGDQT